MSKNPDSDFEAQALVLLLFFLLAVVLFAMLYFDYAALGRADRDRLSGLDVLEGHLNSEEAEHSTPRKYLSY